MKKLQIKSLNENGKKAMDIAKEEVFYKPKFLQHFIISYTIDTILLQWKDKRLAQAEKAGFDMSGFLIDNTKKSIIKDFEKWGAVLEKDYLLEVVD